MKEQVTDISKVLQDMTAEMRLMRETIDQQYAEIAKLNRNIEALNRQIRKKDEENARLNPHCATSRTRLLIIIVNRSFQSLSLIHISEPTRPY